MVERENELESRISETTKKYDDSKRSYFKSKEERERLRAEVERLGGNAGAKPESTGDVGHKYEQLKIKFR